MKLAFIDIETTGLSPDFHEVWEIALLLENDDRSETTYRWTFLPERLRYAEPAALRINRFYDRVDELPRETGTARFWLDENEMDRPTTRMALAHLAELTAGAHLVGNNPAFDAAWIDGMMRDNDVAPAWHYHLVDVEALLLGFLAGRGRWPSLRKAVKGESWSSRALAEAIGVPSPANAHSALADARWAHDLYAGVMGWDSLDEEATA